jgi:hypothetical protein
MSKTSNRQKVETLAIWLKELQKKSKPKKKQPQWLKDLDYED